MRARRVRLLLAAAAGAAVLVVGSLIGIAAAHKPRYNSKVTIHTRFDQGAAKPYVYYGRVISDRKGCFRHRKVVLRNEAEPVPYPGDTDLTNRHGRWKIAFQGDLLFGDYYAKAPRKETRHVVCRGDRSRSVPAPMPPGP